MARYKTISIIPLLLIALLTAAILCGVRDEIAAKIPGGLGENHALIIGINQYAQWPELKSPVRDAEAMAKTLAEKYNFKKSNIQLLTDNTKEKPTLINILTAFDTYTGALGDKDNLLVFFSGHSTEDEEGETYWIPIDGKETTKLTWLKHADIIEAYLGSDSFKAKNVCILADSMFNRKLVRPFTVPVTFDNLRYAEKIVERAHRKSREVIAFGDHHWPGDQNTNGLGLFTYHIQKALEENELDVLDFENLIFDETILFPISKIAGTRLLGGRIRSKMAQSGQFVFARTIPLPVVNVVATDVSPQKGYPGDSFTFTAETSEPAYAVFVEIDGKRRPMKGKGKKWTLAAKFDDIGKLRYRMFATNENDVAGKEQKGEIAVIKKLAEVANVVQATVVPEQGRQGDKFRFTASTDRPAKQVDLIVNGKPYKMTGSGTDWSLTQSVEETGKIEFSVAAINEDDVRGATRGGDLTVEAMPVNVVKVQTNPDPGFAGEEFTITVNTDRNAKSVVLNMDGKEFPMEGSEKRWQLKTTVSEIGTKSFTVAAINQDDVTGGRKTGEIVAKKSPLPIPNVASADVNVVSPGKGYVGDNWAIKAQTSAPSEKVFVEIEGKRFPMKGSDRSWETVAKLDKQGPNAYRIVAVNKDGAQGKPLEGTITARKRPSVPVNVVKAAVTPEKGHSAKPFEFKATTDRPAKSVVLLIGKTRYRMTGKDTEWELSRKIDSSGKKNYVVVALNEDGKAGRPQRGTFDVFRQRFRLNADNTVTDLISGKKTQRFVDNGDGTVTDVLTSLMWLQSPKQIAVDYNEAVDYCRSLKVSGRSGWRLPTIAELNRLSDKKRQNPALPAGHPFTNVITHVGYWSKTTHKFGPQYVYQMSMWYGKSNHQKKTENAIVWPVRYTETPGG